MLFLSLDHLLHFKEMYLGVTAGWQWAQRANTLSPSPDAFTGCPQVQVPHRLWQGPDAVHELLSYLPRHPP